MAYADQQMSGNRITAIIIVAVIHVVLGYALVTGLAFSAAKKVIEKVTTIDIKEEVKKEEPPPPPPKKMDIPPPVTRIVSPPTKINIAPVQAPPLDTTPVPVPPPPPLPPPVAAPPPAPRFTPKSAVPKGNPGTWATTNDYPSRALREERAGVTGFRVTVTADGRAGSCTVTSSSGSPDLDEATCSNVTRRARFTPAVDGEGKPTTGSYSGRIRWVIPKD
jgi:protein TonB